MATRVSPLHQVTVIGRQYASLCLGRPLFGNLLAHSRDAPHGAECRFYVVVLVSDFDNLWKYSTRICVLSIHDDFI